MSIKEISSSHNPIFKDLVTLIRKSGERRERNTIVIEGKREILRSVESGITPQTLFYSPEILNLEDFLKECRFDENNIPFDIFAITKNLYAKIAIREGSEGIIALSERPSITLDSIDLPENPLIVVMESVEKPGNLGAVIRTCDAAKCDLLICCDQETDIYNPNVIRSSLGGVFTLPIVSTDSKSAIEWLKRKNITIFTAQLQDAEPYYNADMSGACAIIAGSESEGLTNSWRENAEKRIYIPMLGKIDSLNVSVSIAILCYEAVRQRLKKV